MKKLISITEELIAALEPLRFGPPVTHVYNPLVYAREPHSRYIKRYARRRCEIVLVGMNPGPFGMAQTGVPFGEVGLVRDWMRIRGTVTKPKNEHSKRPILGFDCPRSEVSGARLWGWARDTFGTPEKFFERFFIINYCPLVFMEESGRNSTPDKLPKNEREPLFSACDRALRQSIECMKPDLVVGIGNFAAARAREALDGLDATIGKVLHPSPQSPAANRGWAKAVKADFKALGITLPS